jgi:hypothetical protein
MENKTAVEWFRKELESMDTKSYDRLIQIEMDRDNFIHICEQAKEMEKEQMRLIYEGLLQNVGTCIKQSDLPTFEQYYNETFKK